jgi:glycosyltransferase involved in cell wall biosynthesis
MKIAVLACSNIWGGAEVHAVGLIRVLRQRGHEAIIYGLDDITQALYDKMAPEARPIASLSVNSRGFLSCFLTLKKIKAQACVFVKGTLNAGGLALDLAARTRFRRYITIEQLEPPTLPKRSSKRYLGGLLPGLGIWWYRYFLRGFLRSVGPHRVVGCSVAVKQKLTGNYKFPDDKVVAVCNGVDLEQFCFDAGRREETRRKWGMPDDALVFGSVRRLCWEKGLDLAIAAFAKLVAKFPDRNLTLVLVGEGPDKMALQEQACKLGIEKRVHFLGFDPNPSKLYPAIDVFLMPSRWEAFGIALVEAMASGCICIGSRVGGIPEIISHPSLGWLVDLDNKDDLLNAMSAATVLNETDRKEMIRRNREYVKENFEAGTQFSKTAKIIENHGIRKG